MFTCKKVICLFSLFVVCSSISQGADIEWRGGGGNNLWTNPQNWLGNSAPAAGDNAFLKTPYAEAPNGPVIRAGIDVSANGLSTEVAGESTMTMTGGTLALSDYIWWGDDNGSHGIFNMSGGTVTIGSELELGWGGGSGTWIMTGGTVTCGRLRIPTPTGTLGELYLHGGTFNVGSSGLDLNAPGLIDIGNGVLNFEGDLKTQIDGFVSTRQIVAYGGIGTVVVTYNGKTTTVTALGSPMATEPSPANEATDVPREVVLGWTAGYYTPPTNGHTVYFSENFNDVKDGIGGIIQDSNSYTPPQRLDLGTTYYWRVDEVDAPPASAVLEGEVWSFTTEPVGYPIDGANITATASSVAEGGFGPEKTIDGSGLNDNDGHSTEPLGMWMSDSLGPQPTWIEYQFDKVYKLHEMWVWNGNQAFESFLGFGLRDVTVEYSSDGVEWTTLADAPEFAQSPAPPTDDYAHNTTVDFGGAAAKHVRLTVNTNWASVLPQSSLSEVRFFHIPVSAREPSPDSGATDVSVDVTLAWRAGREAAEHNVYMSTDEQAVTEGTAPAVAVTDASYSPALDLDTSYYWRIDEVNDAETPGTWESDVWSFTTSDHIVVDDFESYNDIDPPDPDSNRIFEAWPDGFSTPTTNGALIGYDPAQPSYAETTTVHGGFQSMPMFYSNTGPVSSEGTRTFAVAQDWTAHSVTTLGLWFQGTAGNTGQLYVKINGSKIPYNGGLDLEVWQFWPIDLASSGLNLQSVSSLTIGVEGNGTSGTLYFDDIRLYASAPVPPN